MPKWYNLLKNETLINLLINMLEWVVFATIVAAIAVFICGVMPKHLAVSTGSNETVCSLACSHRNPVWPLDAEDGEKISTITQSLFQSVLFLLVQ